MPDVLGGQAEKFGTGNRGGFDPDFQAGTCLAKGPK